MLLGSRQQNTPPTTEGAGPQQNIKDPNKEWNAPDYDVPILIQYDEYNEAPYLVLMESTREDRNIRQYSTIN